MREKINEKLLEIESDRKRVHYGIVTEEAMSKLKDWNFFVFNQDRVRKSGTSLTDLNGYWNVIIVREDYIPDELVFEVIEKLTSIAGLRLADNDFSYEYLQKGNTDIVVETLMLTFTKTKKRC